ncbi:MULTISPECIES: citrate lyase holo-[acyl-carrier protein] synthase [Clostridium]|uniref:citrate lyase holo-[acyl-carrier protein] synthase n=1 Tax=Clostridium TaxID=1485 RepID=UPI00177DEF3A|nr:MULTISPECIES: citrate lyase holo-[acyl-carrier protein] synthase [Clostridium]
MNSEEMLKADKLLKAREDRVAFVEKLINEYKTPVVCARSNYPGLNKANEITEILMTVADRVLTEKLDDKTIFKTKMTTAEGDVIIMVVEGDAIEIKKTTVEIEHSHELGRFLDIDVYDKENNSISREHLGYYRRKCFICDEDAHICVRNRSHHIDEIEDHIRRTVKDYMENNDV